MNTQFVLDFLKDLKLNNNRDWFQLNKNRYDNAKLEVEKFAAELILLISAVDSSVQMPLVKDCMFRIFRDVRFGADKSPYKTNFGFFIARGSRKSIYPGYYFHFEPDACMIAAGIYQPNPDSLKLLRNEVYFNSIEFKNILEKPTFKKQFPQLDDFDKMKKAPKDFPADFHNVDLLKYRSYIVSQNVSDKMVVSNQYLVHIETLIKELQPFMQFLNKAISNA